MTDENSTANAGQTAAQPEQTWWDIGRERSEVFKYHRIPQFYAEEYAKIFSGNLILTNKKDDPETLRLFLSISCLSKAVSVLNKQHKENLAKIDAFSNQFTELQKNILNNETRKNMSKQVLILGALRKNPHISGKDLAAELGVSAPLVSIVRQKYKTELDMIKNKKENDKNVSDTKASG